MLPPRLVPSERAPGVPEPEELWEAEMERLRCSGAPVRGLPYAMMDKRLIWQLREPAGVQTLRWQRWQRRRQTVERRLREAAQRLTRGLGLWEAALYEIGGLFGTGIRSYFTFLRFLLLLNLLSLLLTASFVLLPLAWLRPPDPGPALNLTHQCPGSRQSQPGVLRFHNQLWHVLTGRAFTNTYLFYGAYRVGPESSSVYSIRLAYLLSPLACLLLCFCGTLRRMVKGLPQKTLLGQGYQAPLSAKVFSSWDFCIRVQEAAIIKKHEISNEFKLPLSPHFLAGGAGGGPSLPADAAADAGPEGLPPALLPAGQHTHRAPGGWGHQRHLLGYQVLTGQQGGVPVSAAPVPAPWGHRPGQLPGSPAVHIPGPAGELPSQHGSQPHPDVCWENSVGEELYKLSIFNFLLTVAFAFLVTLPRRLLVDQFSGRFWAWLEREEFLVPKNVLDIVAGQTVTWMGLFYCPLLPLLNSVFLFLTFYIKKYTLLKNSRASSRPFRASSSTFFFQLVLLLGLLLAAVPLGYVVSSIHSSWDCGLFTNYSAPWQVVPELVALGLPPIGQRALHYLGSHAFSFPLLIMLSLVLTVCISQTQANARAIHRLRKQLVWQVQEKWHLVEDLSRLLPEPGQSDSPGPKSPASQASRPRSFCPGFPCPGSPGARAPPPGPSVVDAAGLRSTCPGPHGTPASARRFRFPSVAEL
ncbi:transmembrane channel-like protein 8 isoform X4 [Macaca thibetana thibetana]|uniref:transmembrane channel-like protein 8 isoform X4 n=1 Tax=Macaca thibetana thibetana TaxID=257877 RepID=UPI0021BC620F|nr:transmembrane channel-like protein 8 isoform X4 [Macaca thibetana thibetana]